MLLWIAVYALIGLPDAFQVRRSVRTMVVMGICSWGLFNAFSNALAESSKEPSYWDKEYQGWFMKSTLRQQRAGGNFILSVFLLKAFVNMEIRKKQFAFIKFSAEMVEVEEVEEEVDGDDEVEGDQNNLCGSEAREEGNEDADENRHHS